ncbi:hypothetical protein [Mycobacteroides abscessus]|uniref:hypothetical protein n=1 Tax=Mycobacteroides abscessus TaxID=36809 RepID=UPI0009A75DDA|nr:hypothetical protein [Mycobacteroides abscessus]SLC41943.1 Uncharacterised protein [Mycobacteroides abscessus subsp. abscessus]
MRISTLIALASLAASVLLGVLSAALGGTSTRCTPTQRPLPEGGYTTLQDCAVGAVTPGKVFAGIALLFFAAAILAAVGAMTRPMDGALSPTVAAAADGGARAAAAARQAAAARAERRAQQGYGGGYAANSGAGYIDAEVIADYPMDGEDWLNADPEPEPAPTTNDDRPRSGWGRSVNFGD